MLNLMIRVDSLLSDRTHSLFITERVNKVVLLKERLLEEMQILFSISEIVPHLTLINWILILQIHQAHPLTLLKRSLDRYLVKEIASKDLNLDLTRKEVQKVHGTIAMMHLKLLLKVIDKII